MAHRSPLVRSLKEQVDNLPSRRRRAEQALISVVATSYLLGVSTRRVDKLVEQLGIKHISKSQVSQMAKTLDQQVEAFRTRALDTGPYTFAWLDALTQKVREGGRTINVHALVATAVNANGQREILGLEVTSAEDGEAGLQAVQAQRPDVILLDLMMPRLDGFGLIEKLRADPALRDIPVIVISAKELSREESTRLKESVAFVMKKQGFDGDLLMQEINSIVKG